MASWLWENDRHDYSRFSAESNALLEKGWNAYKAAKDAGKTTKRPDIKIGKTEHSICFDRFTQKNKLTGKIRAIRRVQADGQVDMHGFVWEWEGKKDHWTMYPVEVSTQIEKAFLNEDLLTHVKVPVSAHDIHDLTIHFGHMHQENPETKVTRKVRRAMRRVHSAVAPMTPTFDGKKGAKKGMVPKGAKLEDITDDTAWISTLKREASSSPVEAAMQRLTGKKRPRDEDDEEAE